MVSPADTKLSESKAFKKSKKITPKDMETDETKNFKNKLRVKAIAKNNGTKKKSNCCGFA